MSILTDLYTEAARVARMIEGTNLVMSDVVKCDGDKMRAMPERSHPPGHYTFALGIVEGKPVFDGDILYSQNGEEFIAPYVYYGNKMTFEENNKWTWNPPKPKTIMIEMLVEDAEYWISNASMHGRLPNTSAYNKASNNFYTACEEALKIK